MISYCSQKSNFTAILNRSLNRSPELSETFAYQAATIDRAVILLVSTRSSRKGRTMKKWIFIGVGIFLLVVVVVAAVVLPKVDVPAL